MEFAENSLGLFQCQILKGNPEFRKVSVIRQALIDIGWDDQRFKAMLAKDLKAARRCRSKNQARLRRRSGIGKRNATTDRFDNGH